MSKIIKDFLKKCKKIVLKIHNFGEISQISRMYPSLYGLLPLLMKRLCADEQKIKSDLHKQSLFILKDIKD